MTTPEPGGVVDDYQHDVADSRFLRPSRELSHDRARLPRPRRVGADRLAEIAARGLIFIRADPEIALMCFMPVGTGEVSTCDVRVAEGRHVTKGDEIGMLDFGGLTACLLFRPGIALEFDTRDQEPGLETSSIPVRARVATLG